MGWGRTRVRRIYGIRNQRIRKPRVVGCRCSQNIRLVEQVEDLAQNRDAHPFLNAEVFRDAQIEAVERVVETCAVVHEWQRRTCASTRPQRWWTSGPHRR